MGARETQDICSSIISLISVTWLCAERFGSALSALYKAEVGLPWSCECRIEGWGGKLGLMLSAVAVVSLGDRQQLLPLQTHFTMTVSQMILSDCFSIWAMNNNRTGIHLQSVFSFFSSGNGNELVLSCHAHMHSTCPFWHSKTNPNTVLTKGSQWRLKRRKEGCSFSLLAVWWAMCLTAPSRGKKISNITQELICTGTHLLHCSWPAGALSHHPEACSGGCKRLRYGCRYSLEVWE